MSRTRSAATRGFTLLEVLVVVTVMGIVLAMAVPSIARSTAASKVEQGIVVVHGDLQRAMAASSQQRVSVELTWDATTQRLLGETVTLAGTRDTVINRVFGASTDYASTLAVTSGGVAQSSATILPNGFVTKALCFTMTASGGNGGQVRRLTMTRAGQVRILRNPSTCS